MSFFQKKSAKGGRKRKNNPVAGPPRKSKKNHHDDDEEILSDASDVEGRPGNNGDPGYESVDDGDGDDLRETAEEKAVRLAKIHLEEIEREERERLGDDADADVHAAVSSRLRREELEESGKFRRDLAEQARERDFSAAAATATGREGKKAHKSALTAVAVSPCGQYAFTASKDGGLVKWAMGEDGEGGAASVRRVARVCAAGGHGAREEDVKKGKKAKSHKKKSNYGPRINALAVSSDGKFLATGDDAKLVNIWDASTLAHLHTFRGHRDAVSGLAFRRKTRTLFSCSHDRSVKVWNVDEMAYVETLFGHQDRITGVDAGVRERAVTSGGRDGTVRVWKIVEESQLVFNGPATSVDSVRLIDEDHFVTCGEDGHVSVWGTMKKKPLLTVREAHGVDEGGNGQANWVSAIAAMPMSDLIATGSRDGFIRLWKVSSSYRQMEEVNRIPVKGFVNSIAFSADGARLAAAVGQEHRLGRWWTHKEAKNSVVVVSLKLDLDATEAQ